MTYLYKNTKYNNICNQILAFLAKSKIFKRFFLVETPFQFLGFQLNKLIHL